MNKVYVVMSGSDADWFIAKNKKQVKEYLSNELELVDDEYDTIEICKNWRKELENVDFGYDLLEYDLEKAIHIASNYE